MTFRMDLNPFLPQPTSRRRPRADVPGISSRVLSIRSGARFDLRQSPRGAMGRETPAYASEESSEASSVDDLASSAARDDVVASGRTQAPDGKVYFSYGQIASAVSAAVPRVKAFAPDVIVAIGGGGFIPARMLRTECKVPILAISLELYDDRTKTTRDKVELKQWFDEGSGFGALVRGRRVLIVDEVDDTRATLQYAVEEIKKRNEPAAIGVLVVHNKLKPKKGVLPDDITYIAGEDVPNVWNCYPWDAAAYGRDIYAHEDLARQCAGEPAVVASAPRAKGKAAVDASPGPTKTIVKKATKASSAVA